MLDPTQLDVLPNAGDGIIYIPLDQLMLSNLNVRQTERDADIATLAEDIAARGLKQNLVVVAAHFSTGVAEADWSGKFEVVAGGRRFQALSLLAADERIPADHAVPCLVEDRDQARETSLSENLHKVTMNPADEFDAYAAIVDDFMHRQGDQGTEASDEAIAYCARRFGKTVTHVAGRLRLSALAPEILQALRENLLGLESAKAYARVTDHKLQLKVFKEQAKNPWKKHNPEYIRSDLAGNTCAIDDRRIVFVGLEAFRDAGGRTEVEMFMGTLGGERVLDVALLDKLVAAKAEAAIPALAKADGFKEGLYAKGGNWPKAPKGFERAWDQYYGSKPPTKAQKAKSIAVYELEHDGAGLKRIGRFKPEEKGKSPVHTLETPEQRAARERASAIDLVAARLAVGPMSGTPLEGRAFWPRWQAPRFEIDRNDEAFAWVGIQIRVPVAEIDAQREAAEKQYDEDLAAEEARRAELAAAAEAAGDDETDVEEDDADEDEAS